MYLHVSYQRLWKWNPSQAYPSLPNHTHNDTCHWYRCMCKDAIQWQVQCRNERCNERIWLQLVFILVLDSYQTDMCPAGTPLPALPTPQPVHGTLPPYMFSLAHTCETCSSGSPSAPSCWCNRGWCNHHLMCVSVRRYSGQGWCGSACNWSCLWMG